MCFYNLDNQKKGNEIMEHMDPKIIKLRITYYRKRKGISMERLAEQADISVGYLASLVAENSRFNPTFKVLDNLAKALDVPLYLFFLPEELWEP